MTELMLGVETSCDDTGAAIVTEDLEVVSNIVSSQMEIHARYGGVVPEIASRVHVSEVIPVVSQAMTEAGVSGGDLTAVAVTRGPGLIGSLLVGVSVAKALALTWKKPVVGVNHLEGHLASASLGQDTVEYPCLVLLVSGGHSLLARVSSPGVYVVLGSTRDDSAGEAYDKVARLLGLGYPGGPAIDRLAPEGSDVLKFPRPMIHDGLEFSFSGLKSAVANYLRRETEYVPEDVAASFAAAVMDVLLAKLERALERADFRSVAVVGGVAASPLLREQLAEMSRRRSIKVCLPPLAMATDNAAMIAAAAWPRYRANGGDPLDFEADPGLRLPE
ncbi:MAG: tRNA (adenosine(37)-N6)-threonylcarbamoyltransferase complex transferase subunit TsaD [bacterium]|nr:tRNA (adenosine(37)-N6)-threonylcarbamoyltransferase complex transferase subunit TsaD [bacterium]